MAVATRIAAKFNTYYAERPGKPDPLLPLHPGVEVATEWTGADDDNSTHDYGHQRRKLHLAWDLLLYSLSFYTCGEQWLTRELSSRYSVEWPIPLRS